MREKDGKYCIKKRGGIEREERERREREEREKGERRERVSERERWKILYKKEGKD